MTDFLNLPNVTTTAVNEETDRYTVEARATEPKAQTCRLFCPVLKNGKRWREINDTPIHGKPVLIRYHVQRFTCSECGNGGLYEGQPFLQPGFWMTRRLLVHIAKQSMRRTFAEVARECFVDAKTASNAFRAYVDERVTALDRKTPRVLGIDEKMLLGSYRAVLGNIEERTVLNMLPDRKAALEAYLADLPEKARVEVVVTDRYEDYRRIVRQKMPGRLHVTDRFHVTDKASAMLDKIRSDIAKRLSDGRQRARLRMAKNLFRSRWASIPEETRAELQRWFAEIPVLSDAYWAKEHYCDMYLCDSPAAAWAYRDGSWAAGTARWDQPGHRLGQVERRVRRGSGVVLSGPDREAGERLISPTARFRRGRLRARINRSFRIPPFRARRSGLCRVGFGHRSQRLGHIRPLVTALKFTITLYLLVFLVSALGLEPRTYRLKVRCSTS